jgi:nitrogen regulatory protein PII
MTKTDLKKVLKPLIKECIKETLFEEGVLSSVISEVVKGLGGSRQSITENKQDKNQIEQLQLEQRKKRTQQLNETKKKMLDVINKDAYGGVDIFEGTMPISQAGSPDASPSTQGPLSGVDPSDPGVDISGIFGKFR